MPDKHNNVVDPKYITSSREPFFEVCGRYIKSKDTVVDIGCGTDSFAKVIRKKDVHFIDQSEEACKTLREKGYRYVHCQSAADPLPFRDKAAHVIHCSHLVEHLQPDEVYALLKEMDRCLKYNGFIMISAPLLWAGFYDDLSHVKPYSPKVFRSYMVSGTGTNRTRPVIGGYAEVKEVSRYTYKSAEISFDPETLESFVDPGIYKLHKTGFTLILKKIRPES